MGAESNGVLSGRVVDGFVTTLTVAHLQRTGHQVARDFLTCQECQQLWLHAETEDIATRLATDKWHVGEVVKQLVPLRYYLIPAGNTQYLMRAASAVKATSLLRTCEGVAAFGEPVEIPQTMAYIVVKYNEPEQFGNSILRFLAHNTIFTGMITENQQLPMRALSDSFVETATVAIS